MKQLQNNFTTPEQSKRLLELGLPADSADFHYIGGIENYIYHNQGKTISEIQSIAGNNLSHPCWSAGRLIEIYHICVSSGFSFNVCFPNIMNEIMYSLREAYSNGWLHLEKLEE
jgi:hypothetical protein